MSVGIISNTTFPSIGFAISAARNGRTSLPVSPGLVIYSHFKHVSGTPAPEGTRGVNISKLKILDTLIEQLSRLKNQPMADMGTVSENDEKRINALIEHYQSQLRTAQAANFYTPASASASAGMLFSISA